MVFDNNLHIRTYLNAIDSLQVYLGSKNIEYLNNENSSFIFNQYYLMRSFAHLRPYLKNDSTVFDLGGGDGNLISPFTKQGIECYLLEPCLRNSLLAEKKELKL